MPMKNRKKQMLLSAALLLAAAVLLAALLPGIQRDIRENSRDAIRDTVIRCAVECYAVEGAYPDSLQYLEDHYGLTVNHRDFIVTYEVFASNQLPAVQVLVRGEG